MTVQEMQTPSGEMFREYFSAQKQRVLTARMNERRAELEARGYTFVGRRKIGRNEPCPCNSGAKFKRCCISKMERVADATFRKP
jgi:uncharacterized protein YecA (UPF0149 family)